MNISSVRHKGLRRMIEVNDGRGLRPDQVGRVRNILTALITAETIGDLRGPPRWRVHQLAGDRAGTWSISVTGNWRMTFKLNGVDITDLDLEDYH